MDYEFTSAVLFVVACAGWAAALAATLSAALYRRDGNEWRHTLDIEDRWMERAIAAEEKLDVLERIFNDDEPQGVGQSQ